MRTTIEIRLMKMIQTIMMREKKMSMRDSSRTQSLTTRRKANGKTTNRVSCKRKISGPRELSGLKTSSTKLDRAPIRLFSVGYHGLKSN